MFDLAENLDFEEAANIRDEIKRLENVELEIGLDPFIRQRKLETLTEEKWEISKHVQVSRSKGGAAGTRVIRGKIVKKYFKFLHHLIELNKRHGSSILSVFNKR